MTEHDTLPNCRCPVCCEETKRKLYPEEMATVAARIDRRLANIISKQAKDAGILFQDACGKYVLIGIESKRLEK